MPFLSPIVRKSATVLSNLEQALLNQLVTNLRQRQEIERVICEHCDLKRAAELFIEAEARAAADTFVPAPAPVLHVLKR